MGVMMIEVKGEGELKDLVRLQSDELRKKNCVIADMEAMLEEQANRLTRSRAELNSCRAMLGMEASV